MNSFVALDFETADYGRDSACSIGLFRVDNHKITRGEHYLIKPPRKTFLFTELHGISWNDVSNSPTFRELWPQLSDFLTGAEFLAAHNASFDKSVLHACCAAGGITPPAQPFQCTVKLARNVLNIRPANLANVCHHLSIGLDHHNALSDAKACAQIMITALQTRPLPAPGKK